MSSPTISRRARPAYPILLLLAPVLAAGCATTRPGVPDGAAPTPPSVWATAEQPASQSPTPAATDPSPPAPSSAGPSATAPRTGLKHVFPVRADDVDYHPTHGAYPATDLFADCGEPFVAVTDGTVLEVSRVDRYRKRGPQGPDNGGLSVSLLGDDGVRYYGSHLSVVTSGVDAGVRVRAGQQLGKVGRTGNANNVCHVHFGISPPCAGQGRLVDPARGDLAGALPGLLAARRQPGAGRRGHRVATQARLPEGALTWLAREIPSPTCAASRSCWSGRTRRPTGSGRSGRRRRRWPACPPAELAARAGNGTLTELAGVGDVTARCVAESLAGEEPVYLRRLVATEGSDLDAEAHGAARRPARRLPHPLRLVRRRLADRGDGAGRGRAGPRVPGADRPLAPADRRPRADRGAAAPAARPRGARSTRRCPEGFRILTGIEVDILADGSLDQEDDAAGPARRGGRLGAQRAARTSGRR